MQRSDPAIRAAQTGGVRSGGLPALRVLLVDDSPQRAVRIEEKLRAGGYSPTLERVTTEHAFLAAARRTGWDIVVCADELERFSAGAAVALLNDHAAHVPLIVLSDHPTLEAAVGLVRAGAADYLPSDDGARLLSAIRRELSPTLRRHHRPQADDTTEATRQRRATFIDSATDLFMLFDARLRFLDVNPAALAALNMERHEIIGKHILDVFPYLADSDRYRKHQAVVETGESLSIDDLVPGPWPLTDFGRQHYAVSAFRAGDGLGLIASDVTRRRQLELQVREDARSLDFLSRSAMGFVELQPDEDIYRVIGERIGELAGRALVAVCAFEETTQTLAVRSISGLSPAEAAACADLLGRDPPGLHLPASASARAVLMRGKLLKAPRHLYDLCFGHLPKPACRAAEEILDLHDAYAIGFARKGTLYGGAVLVARTPAEVGRREVLEILINQAAVALQRRQAELRLRWSERHFRSLIENVSDLILIADRHGVVSYESPSAQRRLGYPRGRMTGASVFDFLHPGGLHHFLRAFRHLLQRPGGASTLELRVRHSDGSWRVFESVAHNLLHDPTVGGVVIHARDITERNVLRDAILEISEAEQRRIGNDLHDGLGQQLAGIAFMARSLTRDLADRSAPEAQTAREIEQLTRAAAAQACTLAQGLSPVKLAGGSLASALRTLAAQARSMFGIDCTFECQEPINLPAGEAPTHLYRIAQEAIHNAACHGHATRVCIQLTNGQAATTLAIADDGTGLPDPADRRDGMGLLIMEQRARAIGASLTIRGRPAHGTRVACTLDHSPPSQPTTPANGPPDGHPPTRAEGT